MEAIGIALVVGMMIGSAIGYLLFHAHSQALNNAIARATTIPAGDVATLNAAVAGLGDQLQQISKKVGVAAQGAAPTL